MLSALATDRGAQYLVITRSGSVLKAVSAVLIIDTSTGAVPRSSADGPLPAEYRVWCLPSETDGLSGFGGAFENLSDFNRSPLPGKATQILVSFPNKPFAENLILGE